MVFFVVEYYGEVLFMKEKLGASLGMFGVILWELVLFVICFMPFMILGFPFWLAVIVVILMNVLPVLGGAVSLGLYIWAFTSFITPAVKHGTGRGIYLVKIRLTRPLPIF